MSASRSSTVALTVAPPGTNRGHWPLVLATTPGALVRDLDEGHERAAVVEDARLVPRLEPARAASSGWIRTAGRPDRFRWLATFANSEFRK
jgi:hypothetical protein